MLFLIERIDTLCLKVKDVENSSKWYQDILGFKEAFKGEGYRVLSVGEGGVPLTIEEGETQSSVNQSYPIFYTSYIHQTYDELKDQNVRVSDLHNDGVNHYFDLYDIDNNKLQVCFFQ